MLTRLKIIIKIIETTMLIGMMLTKTNKFKIIVKTVVIMTKIKIVNRMIIKIIIRRTIILMATQTMVTTLPTMVKMMVTTIK